MWPDEKEKTIAPWVPTECDLILEVHTERGSEMEEITPVALKKVIYDYLRVVHREVGPVTPEVTEEQVETVYHYVLQAQHRLDVEFPYLIR